jgi:hypothetical protein
MFQAEARGGNTASFSSTRSVISDTVATYVISDEQGSKKKVLDNRQWTAVNRGGMAWKTVIVVWLVALTFAPVRFAEAQQPKKVPRIGYVSGTGSPSDPGPYVEALRQGLRDLGHFDGKNILIEYRGAEGKVDRIPSLVAELVQLNVDVLVVVTHHRSAQPSRRPKRSPLLWWLEIQSQVG